KGQNAKKFRNEDLPGYPMTIQGFHDILMPQWLFYYASLDSVWKLAKTDHVDHAQ
ncbi:hypothetical protein PAXRUDRAFT_177010, partial [Paxillus rubicundulus Ve08.2h10]